MLFAFNWIMFLTNTLYIYLFFSSVLQRKRLGIFIAGIAATLIVATVTNVMPLSFWAKIGPFPLDAMIKDILHFSSLIKLHLGFLKPILCHLLVFAIMCKVYEGRKKKKIITYIEHAIALHISELSSLLIFLAIAEDPSFTDMSPERIVAMLFFNISYFFFMMTFVNAFHRKSSRLDKLQFQLILCLLVFVQIAMLFLFYSKNHEQNAVSLIRFSIFLGAILLLSILSYMVIVQTLADIKRIEKKEEELQRFHLQKEQDERHYELALENIRRISKIRHDIANQIQAVHILFSVGKAAEKQTAKELLDQISKKIKETKQ